MKKNLIVAGIFAGMGLLGFLFGFFSQTGKIRTLREESESCHAAVAAQKASALVTVGLLELYRARAELGRANFGSAGDALGRAKASLPGEEWAETRIAIDKTTALVLKQEAAASDEIGAIIKSVEAKGPTALPKSP